MGKKAKKKICTDKTPKKKKLIEKSDSQRKQDQIQVKKGKSEIDDLFAGLKQKKKVVQEQKQKQKEEKIQEINKKKQFQKQVEECEKHAHQNSTIGSSTDSDPKPVRFDADGLAIYSEESLKINKGGDSGDCPFDCWCCF